MTKDELGILLPLLKARIPYDEDFFENTREWEVGLTNLLEDSRNILLSKLYPFEDFSDYLIPLNKYNWVLRCCVEIFNLADKWGVTSYAENGLSWSRFSDGLSKSLTSELISHVGVPRKKIVEDIVDNKDGDNDDE